jgi:hypothetical protein
MRNVISKDGTPIEFDQVGEGSPLVLQRCSETLSYHSLHEEAIKWVPTCTSMRKRVKHITKTFSARS